MLSLKLVSFNARDVNLDGDSGSEGEQGPKSGLSKEFRVQMFGLDEEGNTYSVDVTGFTPYFYVCVPDDWHSSCKDRLRRAMESAVDSRYFAGTIVSTKLIQRRKLYGFDAGKKSKFVRLNFCSEQAKNKFKSLWYDRNRKLVPFNCYGEPLALFEAHIPSILRLFHSRSISPSGWMRITKNMVTYAKAKKTSCTREFTIDKRWVLPDPHKQSPVPYKIMSFDIETSSSHGDFSQAIKDYRPLAMSLVDNAQHVNGCVISYVRATIEEAFGQGGQFADKVYTKTIPSKRQLMKCIVAFTEQEVHVVADPERHCFSTFDTTLAELLEPRSHSPLDRSTTIDALTMHFTQAGFPPIKGDEITFIGSSFYTSDSPYLNSMLVVGECANLEEVPNVEIQTFKTEKEMLLGWTRVVQEENPDVVIGYNIMGFDFGFMYDRAKELACDKEFLMLSRNASEVCWTEDWKSGRTNIAQSQLVIASGQHDLRYIDMKGRLTIDLYNVFRRDYNLTKYSLDYVSNQFIGDSVVSADFCDQSDTTSLQSKNLAGLQVGSFVVLETIAHSTSPYANGTKFKIRSIDAAAARFTVDGCISKPADTKLRWGLAKDDITAKDIFALSNGTAADKYQVAKYCVKDCTLVYDLFNKIDVMTGYVEMAGLCSVPMMFLVMRGQGIKLTSYMAKKCREKETLMPTLEKSRGNEGYEGAIVLEPKTGMYLDDPVACVDYSSLYPSCMISDNISPDSKVWTKEYDLNGELVAETGEKADGGKFIYDNLPGYKYVDIEYDTYKYLRRGKTKTEVKTKVGRKICRFAQYPDGQLGIIPAILQECLAARKATRALAKTETDPFMKNVLDKRQLSIKVTANSIYGQTGAKTSTFYEIDVAAATTAVGRKLLLYGKSVIEAVYKEREVESEAIGRCIVNAEYVYGDTDSVFFKFNPRTMSGARIAGRDALELTIELAKEAGQIATKFLKAPHDLEYEKTFMPFVLLSKKRYVGMLYENDPTSCARKSMGIVLKRRDNAPIVKDIYGGIIEILMKEKDVDKAATFLEQNLEALVYGRVPVEKLIITKALRGHYKNPKQIAHRVLADRIAERNPGNKPRVGDRIAYVYVKCTKRGALQGDKIETPEYVEEKSLPIDYNHYITNQVMKPVQQLFALVLEDMPAFVKSKGGCLNAWNRSLQCAAEASADAEVQQRKLQSLRNKEVKELLFSNSLRKISGAAVGNSSIMDFLRVHSGL